MTIPEGTENCQSEPKEGLKEKDVQWADGYHRGMLRSAEYFSKWNTMMQELLVKRSEQDNGNGAPKVTDRLQQVGKAFLDLNNIWNDVIKAMPELYKPNGDEAKREEATLSSWQKLAHMNQQAHASIWNAWLEALPQPTKKGEKSAKEDRADLDERLKRSREIFEKTVKQYFDIPGLGITKQHTEMLKMAQAEFAQLTSILPFFYQYLQDTQWTALKEVFDKVRELEIDGSNPEKMHDIYKIWLMTNENAFHELFKRADFCHAMGEVINCTFRLRKRMDDLASKWCATLSIPSSHDYDQMAMAIQSLRQQIRAQGKTIALLQKQIQKNEERGDGENGK